ncbi:putative signal peptide protein [Puccinia sorghi]|uniref:Putative signal peptide protein n=1 Tax=Puccinia sorghi TaxID=27349 RepID=A0A0L6VDK6_9BASI|nr:putative signal peptide protein [Puccinia sorghi]
MSKASGPALCIASITLVSVQISQREKGSPAETGNNEDKTNSHCKVSSLPGAGSLVRRGLGGGSQDDGATAGLGGSGGWLIGKKKKFRFLTGGCTKVWRLEIIPLAGKPLESPRGGYRIITICSQTNLWLFHLSSIFFPILTIIHILQLHHSAKPFHDNFFWALFVKSNHSTLDILQLLLKWKDGWENITDSLNIQLGIKYDQLNDSPLWEYLYNHQMVSEPIHTTHMIELILVNFDWLHSNLYLNKYEGWRSTWSEGLKCLCREMTRTDDFIVSSGCILSSLRRTARLWVWGRLTNEEKTKNVSCLDARNNIPLATRATTICRKIIEYVVLSF